MSISNSSSSTLKIKSIFIIAFLICIKSSFSEDPVKEDYDKRFEQMIPELDGLSYNNFIKKGLFSVVLFYSPNCKKCLEFHPHFNYIVENIFKDTTEIQFGKVNILKEPEIAEKYQLKGIPAILIFKEKDPDVYEKYTGTKTRLKLERYLRRLINKITSELYTEEQIESSVDAYDAILVFIGKPTGKQYEIFTKEVSDEKYDDIHLHHCSLDFCLKLSGAQVNDVVIFKNFEEKKSILKNGFTQEELAEFIIDDYTPDIHDFNPIIFYKTFDKKLPALYYYRDISNTSENIIKTNDALLTRLAPKLKKSLNLVIVDTDKQLGFVPLNFNNIKQEELPLIQIYDFKNDLKRKFSLDIKGKTLNEDEILDFISKWKSGSLKIHLSSEPKTEFKFLEETNVWNLVGSEFESFVNRPNLDVFVLFYADNDCKNCEDHIKTFKGFAKKLKDYNHIKFAVFNQSKNELTKKYTEYYPSFILWPAESKQPVTFRGNYKEDDFLNFIISKGTNPVIIDDL